MSLACGQEGDHSDGPPQTSSSGSSSNYWPCNSLRRVLSFYDTTAWNQYWRRYDNRNTICLPPPVSCSPYLSDPKFHQFFHLIAVMAKSFLHNLYLLLLFRLPIVYASRSRILLQITGSNLSAPGHSGIESHEPSALTLELHLRPMLAEDVMQERWKEHLPTLLWEWKSIRYACAFIFS